MNLKNIGCSMLLRLRALTSGVLIAGVVLVVFARHVYVIYAISNDNRTVNNARSDSDCIAEIPLDIVDKTLDHCNGKTAYQKRLVGVWDRIKIPENASWSELLHYVEFWGAQRNIISSDKQGTCSSILSSILESKSASPSLDCGGFHIVTPDGIRFRTLDSSRGPLHRSGSFRRIAVDPHKDATLATCAMIGVSSKSEMHVCSRSATLHDCIRYVKHNYHPSNASEWTYLSLILYLPPARKWENKYGDQYDFDSVARELMMYNHQGRSACFGAHLSFGLAALLSVDSQSTVLLPSTRSAILNYFDERRRELIARQRRDGAWQPDQMTSKNDTDLTVLTEMEVISYTSHTLEWLAIIDRFAQMDRGSVDSALEYVLNSLESTAADNFESHFVICVHAANALKLWNHANWQSYCESDTLIQGTPGGGGVK